MQQGSDVFFLLMGAILVSAMHGGFAFLETGTVRHKNQVNALVKILVDFAISTVAYFAVGYTIAYGVGFFQSAAAISGGAAGYGTQGYSLVRFFFLCTFAAAVPAIVSGGIAERARFAPQAMATAAVVGLFYPLLEGVYWNGNFGLQETVFNGLLGAPSTISPAQSSCTRSADGWRSAPCCALGRGSAATTDGGRRRRRPRSRGSPWVHPLGALAIGAVAGAIFVQMFQVSTNKWRIDDVLGVWALHGLCGLWGGIACGIFGLAALGGIGGVTFASQFVGSIAGSAFGLLVGLAVYGTLKATLGIRLPAEAERQGADLSIHKIRANPEEDVRMVAA
jgi:Amt family ammonium transporter